MRAVVHDRYGPPEVLRIEEVERPVPKDDEVLVRVRATTVTQDGLPHAPTRGRSSGASCSGCADRKRRVLGLELAGEVEAVGSAVTEFRGGRPRVRHAERRARGVRLRPASERLLAHMPAGTTFEEAAAVCDGFNQGLGHLKAGGRRRGHAARSCTALPGSCGTAAVQLGKHYVGAHVTAVCNTENIELVRSLGADEVIDYLNEDFTKRGQTYDVVLDAVGKHSYFRSRRALEALRTVRRDRPPLQLPAGVPDARRQEEGRFRGRVATPEREHPPPQGTDRDWEVPRRRRPDLPARGRGRGDEVCRHFAEDRQRRADRLALSQAPRPSL